MVQRIKDEWLTDRVATHYDGCWLYHPECAIRRLLAEIEALRATVAGWSQDISNLEDEIERLRSLSDQLAEALDVQCGLHRIPVTTTPYFTQHAKDALASWRKERHA